MVLWRRPRSTRHRPFGGPAFMITHLVNLPVDVPGMRVMRGVPGITGTEDAPRDVRLGQEQTFCTVGRMSAFPL